MATKRYLDVTLNSKQAVWFHVPNGEVRDKSTAGKLKAMGVLPGVSDWVILHSGGVLCVELKTVRTKQSGAQLDFANRCDRLRVTYRVVRSLVEFEMALLEAGLVSRARVAA